MGINFPNTPTVGQLYPNIPGQPTYRWDGEKWAVAAGTGTGVVRYDQNQNLGEANQTQGRVNIYAAPFQAMAYNGMQFNGSCDVSQEKGATLTTATGYICDGWSMFAVGTGALSGGAGNGTGMPGVPAGFVNRIAITVTTAQATFAAGDRFNVSHNIEGYRFARMAWGTAAALPVTLAFWTRHDVAGTYTISLRNATVDRSYVTTYSQSAPNTWEYKTVTIPGDTGGTWAYDNTIGAIITFSFGAGATYTTSTLNAWQAGNFNNANTQVNMLAATSNGFRITGLLVLPGSEAPIAARSSYVMRPYDQELAICKRYYQKIRFFMSCNSLASASIGGSVVLPVEMRGSPTTTLLNNSSSAGLTIGTIATYPPWVTLACTSPSTAGTTIVDLTYALDVRL